MPNYSLPTAADDDIASSIHALTYENTEHKKEFKQLKSVLKALEDTNESNAPKLMRTQTQLILIGAALFTVAQIEAKHYLTSGSTLRQNILNLPQIQAIETASDGEFVKKIALKSFKQWLEVQIVMVHDINSEQSESDINGELSASESLLLESLVRDIPDITKKEFATMAVKPEVSLCVNVSAPAPLCLNEPVSDPSTNAERWYPGKIVVNGVKGTFNLAASLPFLLFAPPSEATTLNNAAPEKGVSAEEKNETLSC